jgi:tetratricopeptide (TPR) repeat protein
MLDVIALQVDNPALAVELIDAADDSRPQDAVILTNLAEAFRRLDCLEDAQRCAEQAVALQPSFATAHVNLGIILKMLGRHDDAEASYRRAIALDPTAANARLNLALLYLLRGGYDEGLTLRKSA